LPLNFKYLDIDESKGTNGALVSHLLLEENNFYKHLKSETSGIEILKLIVETNPNARLLLDVGALMIDLSNRQVAIEWLKLANDKADAAVYFDNENNLVVIDKKDNEVAFETSPYKFQLGRCVIYLDDTHTRGTDLKIPKGVLGTVTLGKGVTKDRLMQACMRMRMLGDGHRVQFFASNEVHTTIEKDFKTLNGQIGSLQVIEWAIKNSQTDINDSFLYWGTQGLSYLKRDAAKLIFSKNKNLEEYFNNFKQTESTELAILYNGDRVEDSIVNILQIRASILEKNLSDSMNDKLREMRQEILKRLNVYCKHERKLIHMLDEEQEVELEVEQEEERELERPPLAKPLRPSLHNDVLNFVKHGNLVLYNGSFVSLPNALMNTSLKKLAQNEDTWMKNILFATQDFKNTIEYNNLDKDDDFLRPCRWIAFSKKQNILVLLSGFEANELMSHFNSSQVTLTRILPRARVDQMLKINFRQVDIPDDLFQPVAIFAGNLYLKSRQEQQSYLNFIAYRPSPRTSNEEKLFEKGQIKQHGYVPEEYRINLNLSSKFKEDPATLIKKLIEIRNYGIVPESAHHNYIFQCGKKP